MEQTRLDNQRDLDRCRSLLVEMEDTELREVLRASRYNAGSQAAKLNANILAHRVVDDKWLEEAAAALHVPTPYKKVLAGGNKFSTHRRQDIVVEDVVTAVQKAMTGLRGAAAERDAQ